MPANDGHTNTWYAILDTKNNELRVTFHKLNYSYQEASQAMIDNNLPPAYADTLLSGIWDNCDVLPEWETAQQGEDIELSEKIIKL